MESDLKGTPQAKLTDAGREEVRQVVLDASEPIAPFWPMRTMIAQNPIHGLEYLPFDEAVRKGKHLLGGNGYLANDEYRRLYRDGRITPESLKHVFEGMAAKAQADDSITIGDRLVTSQDVWRIHLEYGIQPLETSLFDWELKIGAIKRFRLDLPEAARSRIVERTIKECEHCRDNPEEAYVTNLWKSTKALLGLEETSWESHQTREPGQAEAGESPSLKIDLPIERTLGDWVDELQGSHIVEQVNEQLTKWIAAFVDEGLAGWGMPVRESGFYASWRSLSVHDRSGRFLRIKDYQRKVQSLSEDPEGTIARCLAQLRVPQKRWKEYLSRSLSQLQGWTRYIRWLGENPAYHAQRHHPIDTVQYLAVRLFYEAELTQVVCQREWGIDGNIDALMEYWMDRSAEYVQLMEQRTHPVEPWQEGMCRNGWRLFHLFQFLEISPLDLQACSSNEAEKVLDWLDDFPEDRHGPVWLEAYEETFQTEITRKLFAHRGVHPPLETRPRAQLVFCIDVRSESFRRHIESQGPYETFGFAGFFGIPISHQGFDREERSFLCPVLLTPNHAVTEIPRPQQEPALQQYATGTRWHKLGDHLFHDLKQNPVGSLMVIDILGLFFTLGLIGKTVFLKPYYWARSQLRGLFSHSVPTQIAVDAPVDPQQPKSGDVESRGIPGGLAQGFSLEERATCIENGLRAMGLTKNFGRLVCLCGHGSETDNNPYYGALDCGACGGNPGDANARVFAEMANDPEVRVILRDQGLSIPEDTWFLPGKHNTTTDRVTFYDVEELPKSHTEDLRLLQDDLKQAGAHQALERCHRIPNAPREIAPEKAFAHVQARGCDWANPRPEWGLAGNAAFLIGRRALTKGLNLGGRVFLHSYDPIADPQGAILEKIMTAPLIVGEWINTGYYFSGVDPWVYGSGSKVIHNVVGGVGVMLGSQSDLQMGFPLQTVNNGDAHYHEPVRLLAIIEAKPSVISSIIQKHAILQQLFHNQWLNLVAIDPHDFEFHRYHADSTWKNLQPYDKAS